MALFSIILFLVIQIVCFSVNESQASSCSDHTDCPIDQCCGKPRYDVLSIVKSCQPYAKEGECCHGGLITATCECEEGLVCHEHSLLTTLFHTCKGVCKRPDATDSGFSLFG